MREPTRGRGYNVRGPRPLCRATTCPTDDPCCGRGQSGRPAHWLVTTQAATFTDEIDSYTLDKFVKGTSKLFVADRSKVDLTSPVVATDAAVEFTFREDLCFNIPFKPVVSLSGRVVLTRDPSTGLFTSYREYWDQTPNEVVRTARLK